MENDIYTFAVKVFVVSIAIVIMWILLKTIILKNVGKISAHRLKREAYFASLDRDDLLVFLSSKKKRQPMDLLAAINVASNMLDDQRMKQAIESLQFSKVKIVSIRAREVLNGK